MAHKVRLHFRYQKTDSVWISESGRLFPRARVVGVAVCRAMHAAISMKHQIMVAAQLCSADKDDVDRRGVLVTENAW
jgi:hypothetical protein